MLTLVHSPRTRSGNIRWLLEEIGTPYEIREVTFRTADGKGARDPNNPHPHGKVPALIHDGQVVFEGTAIALYLTDLFPEAKLGPRAGEPKRGEYLSWLAYRTGEMEPAFIEKRVGFAHIFGAMPWAPSDEVEEVLNAHLAKNAYFLGEEFSAADVMMGGGIFFMTMFKLMTETPVIEDYCTRITGRPAFQIAMQLDPAG